MWVADSEVGQGFTRNVESLYRTVSAAATLIAEVPILYAATSGSWRWPATALLMINTNTSACSSDIAQSA